MRLRIIAGTLGGRTISAPDGVTTHPMSERVRGSLFNIISDELNDAAVLDAFAGSGSLGIEAISRGAKNVIFVEKDRVAGKILEENIDNLNINDSSKVIHAGLASWIQNNLDTKFDIIFADPPYNNTQFSTVKKLFAMLKPNGLMVLSYPGRGEAPTETGVVVVDNRSYGTAALAFYRKKDA